MGVMEFKIKRAEVAAHMRGEQCLPIVGRLEMQAAGWRSEAAPIIGEGIEEDGAEGEIWGPGQHGAIIRNIKYLFIKFCDRQKIIYVEFSGRGSHRI